MVRSILGKVPSKDRCIFWNIQWYSLLRREFHNFKKIAKFATYRYNIVLYFLSVSRLRYKRCNAYAFRLYKPGELSMPPSDRATFSNISKQFSKTIIFWRIGLFSATLIRSNNVVLRSSSFDDDKQSTFFGSNHPMIELGPNSEIIGNFRIFKKFLGPRVEHQKCSLHSNFEPAYAF